MATPQSGSNSPVIVSSISAGDDDVGRLLSERDAHQLQAIPLPSLGRRGEARLSVAKPDGPGCPTAGLVANADAPAVLNARNRRRVQPSGERRDLDIVVTFAT